MRDSLWDPGIAELVRYGSKSFLQLFGFHGGWGGGGVGGENLHENETITKENRIRSGKTKSGSLL